MQVAKFITSNLEQCGLWPQEAEHVIGLIRASDTHAALADVLDQDMNGYPPQFAAATMAVADSLAIRMLEESAPDHFALEVLRGLQQEPSA